MNAGFQALRRRGAGDRAWAERCATIPATNICDSMSRLAAGDAALRPLHAGGVLRGPAITVGTCAATT